MAKNGFEIKLFFKGKIEFKMVSVNVALQRFGFTNDYKFISWGHIQYNGPGIFDQTRIGGYQTEIIT